MDHDRLGDGAVDAVEDAGSVLELTARVLAELGVLDLELPAARVDDEEDRAAALARGVAAHRGARDDQAVVVAVGVDGAAAAAAWRARGRGVRAPAGRLVVGEQAVEYA